MYKIISLSDFRNAFNGTNQEDRFSYEGLEYIYNYLEDVLPTGGYDFGYELDIQEVASWFSEYESLEVCYRDVNDFRGYDIDEEDLIDFQNGSFIIYMKNGGVIYGS